MQSLTQTPAPRLLVVDDDVQIRQMLGTMLTREGFEVYLAQNGKDAMHYLKSQAIDMVITDIFMPEQDGLETIRMIRREKPDMRIIAMSGGGPGTLEPDIYLKMAGRFGAACVLTKPIEKRQFLQAIRNHLT